MINISLKGTRLTKTANNKIPLTRIQKLIGSYMQKSKQSKANGYIKIRADLTDLVKIRKKYCRRIGVRVTTNDFFVYAIAQAVRDFPLMAATIDISGNELLIPEQVGVGFAVAAPQGLVVPVLKNMTEKSLVDTAVQSEELINKARSNKLMPDDFDGANLVLTGLGMYGIESFYAISPPSATAIISIGNIEEAIVPRNGDFETRRMMYVAMAFDQCAVDEFYAAKFLRKVVDLLEAPALLTQ